MPRHLLVTASALALAISTAHAYDFSAAASAAGGDSKNAAINAGISGVLSGKSTTDAAKDAANAAAASAKQSALNAKDAAMTEAQAKIDAKMPQGSGTGPGLATQIQMDASKRISFKDRAAIAKYAAINKLAAKALGTTTKQNLPADYDSKLAVNTKLDASLEAAGIPISAAAVTGLSAQPAGTTLIQIGKKVVKIDTATHVVLDITPI